MRRDVRRFERRGTVARNRVLRELRKRRNAANRVVRKRRNEAARFLRLQRNSTQRTIKTNGKHAQARTARFRTDLEKAVKPQVDRVQKELQSRPEAGSEPGAAVRLSLSAGEQPTKFLSAT